VFLSKYSVHRNNTISSMVSAVCENLPPWWCSATLYTTQESATVLTIVLCDPLLL
jgi:hypothetical protein